MISKAFVVKYPQIMSQALASQISNSSPCLREEAIKGSEQRFGTRGEGPDESLSLVLQDS